ncbi:uncharacterized protein LOC114271273 [Camellia sinensis]|uniref:Uncharacterized protein n=1 Tax=Camellia sinensis var. sinensis TaxID=542762 RepID=A0A4S4EGR9_CAMSN|nr:uncharacterized protein LOC114271273 [Camellia sinensis]THG15025.1 hypothetical protein TEA_013931 [Camellia sinensis var. sinensis]
MGNAATSCAPSIICSNGVEVVKVLFSDGRLEIYTRPIKAAELMVENPGHFICDSTHLKVGHRIPGLSADEELERRRRQLYFLLPMEMLYSVLTNEEFTSLRNRASKALTKHGSFNFSKIFPVLGVWKDEKITSSGRKSDARHMGKTGSWFSAIKRVFIPRSKETVPRALRMDLSSEETIFPSPLASNLLNTFSTSSKLPRVVTDCLPRVVTRTIGHFGGDREHLG